MEIVTTRSASGDRQGEEQQRQGRRRRKASDGHVVAQLLDSPLPTPRRSCCGSAAGTPRGARAASPQRTHVPFSWESSPGVPKAGSACRGAASFERDVLPPKPPPGRRRGGGIGMGTPCHARAACYGNATTTDATSSDDNGGGGGGSEDDTFSDALDRISSSDRLAARLSSVDGGATSRRLSSFIMDRFLPAANAIATTSTEKRAKKSPRRGRGARRSKHDDEEDVSPAHARRDAHKVCRAPSCEHHVPALQREDSWEYDTHTPPEQQNGGQSQQDEDARGDGDMSPRACGFVVLFPWSVKPVFCGFPWSPARPRTTRRSNVESGSQNGDLSHWYEEKISGSGRREWSSPGGPGLGMSILGTSRRYCADARKALSRLARSATDGEGGGSPRTMSRERRSGKAASSTLHSTSGRMPQLTPPSESWLRHARGSDTVNNKR